MYGRESREQKLRVLHLRERMKQNEAKRNARSYGERTVGSYIERAQAPIKCQASS